MFISSSEEPNRCALLWQVLAHVTELQPSTSPQEQGELLALLMSKKTGHLPSTLPACEQWCQDLHSDPGLPF